MLKSGEQLHHYVVDAEIGGGGRARLYRAHHIHLGHAVTLKVLDPYWAKQAPIRARFAAEGQILARARHPAVVAVTDTIIDSPRGLVALVMDFVEGPSLDQLIRRLDEPPPPELIRALFGPLLHGMHHAHEEGVVHRDLKPGNVLLTRDASGTWMPRIIDFGLAWLREDGAQQLNAAVRTTRGSKWMGTPAYMSPEQIVAKAEPHRRWDVFTLGILLYELTTLQHPFEGKDEEKTMKAITAGKFRPPRELRPNIDAHLEAAILGALRTDPAERFPDCAAMWAALNGELALPAPDPDSQVGPAPKKGGEIPEAALVLPDAPERQQQWVVRGPATIIGSTGHIKLPESFSLEPVHFIIRLVGGQWFIEDRSASGTRVNGARVKRLQLDNGDVIRAGNGFLRFRTGMDPAELPPLEQSDTESKPQYKIWIQWDSGGRVLKVPVTAAGVLVGRDPDCDIHVQDVGVSRRHCQITPKGSDYLLEDLQSANGTWVSGEQIRTHRLVAGDLIKVGSALLQFHRAR